MGLLFCSICWLLGWVLVAPFRLLPGERFAAAPAVGFLAFSTATALLYTQTFTSLWLILIAGILLYARFAKRRLQWHLPHMLKRLPLLLLYAFVSITLAIAFSYHINSGLPWVGLEWLLDDLTFWGHLSEALKVGGRETALSERVFAGQPVTAMRYHYVELWATAGITALTALNPSIVLQTLVWPSIAAMTGLAFFALLKRLSGSNWLAGLFALLAMTGQFWSGWILTDMPQHEVLAQYSAYPMWQPVMNKLNLGLCLLVWLTYALIETRWWLMAAISTALVVVHPFQTYYLMAVYAGMLTLHFAIHRRIWQPGLLLLIAVVLAEVCIVGGYTLFDDYSAPYYVLSNTAEVQSDFLWRYAMHETWLELVRSFILMLPGALLLLGWLIVIWRRTRLNTPGNIWLLVIAIGFIFSLLTTHILHYYFTEGHQLLHVMGWLVFSLILGLGLGLSWRSLSYLQRAVSVIVLLMLAGSFTWRYTYSEWQRWQASKVPYSAAYVSDVQELVNDQLTTSRSKHTVLSAKLVTPDQYEHGPVFPTGRFVQGRLMGRLVDAGPVVDLSLPYCRDCRSPGEMRVHIACMRNAFQVWLNEQHPDYRGYSEVKSQQLQLEFMRAFDIRLLFLSTGDDLPAVFEPYVAKSVQALAAGEQLFILEFND